MVHNDHLEESVPSTGASYQSMQEIVSKRLHEPPLCVKSPPAFADCHGFRLSQISMLPEAGESEARTGLRWRTSAEDTKARKDRSIQSWNNRWRAARKQIRRFRCLVPFETTSGQRMVPSRTHSGRQDRRRPGEVCVMFGCSGRVGDVADQATPSPSSPDRTTRRMPLGRCTPPSLGRQESRDRRWAFGAPLSNFR